jgi:hypothetical protein
MEDKQMLKYKMCANKSCCPELVQVDESTFTITDDYEGKVKLTKDELSLLKKYLDSNLKD